MTLDEVRVAAAAHGYIVVPAREGVTIGHAPLSAPVDDNGNPVGEGFAIYIDGISSEDARLAWCASNDIISNTGK